jgi:hypothetical protein
MIIKYLLYWLPLIVLAVANGSFRQFVLLKHMSELRAHQLSTLSLLLLTTIYVWFIFPYLRIETGKQALLCGFIWLMLTIIFEFTLGRMSKRSWEFLLQDYNLLAGHVWPVYLICLMLLPWGFYVFQTK